MDAKDRRIAAQDQEIADLKALVAKFESKLAYRDGANLLSDSLSGVYDLATIWV